MGGFAASRILEVHGERMIKRTFNPGFRIALPGTANAAQLMQACAANGLGQSDHSALVKALELMAAHPVAPDLTP